MEKSGAVRAKLDFCEFAESSFYKHTPEINSGLSLSQNDKKATIYNFCAH